MFARSSLKASLVLALALAASTAHAEPPAEEPNQTPDSTSTATTRPPIHDQWYLDEQARPALSAVQAAPATTPDPDLWYLDQPVLATEADEAAQATTANISAQPRDSWYRDEFSNSAQLARPHRLQEGI